MNILQAIILSIVEGVTEFLPISSTGHLIIANKLLSIPATEFAKSFDIIIQFGAIAAILLLYGKKVMKQSRVVVPVIGAFIPTAVIGLLFYKLIKNVLLTHDMIVVVSLAVGGIILILVDRMKHKDTHSDVSLMPLTHALLIGLGQSLSIIPGVSRAAATIVTALLLGWTKESAVEFSFLLAVPTIAAAAGLDAAKNIHTIASNLPMLLVGLAGSAVTAAIAVRTFVGYVKKHSLAAFGYYRIAVAALFWLVIRI
jgi:undecaprenyl-diphosphatase